MVRLKSRYILFEIVYPEYEFKATNKLPYEEDFNDKYKELTTEELLAMYKPSHSKISPKWIITEIRARLELLFGEFGVDLSGSSSSLVCKYFSNSTSTGILKCSRDTYEYVMCALLLINDFNGVKGIMKTCCVSGSIKKCEDAAIRRSKKMISDLRR